MGLSEQAGFFSEYYLNLKNSQTADFDKELEKIKQCSNEKERIVFVEGLPCVQEHEKDIEVKRSFCGKNAETAAELKEKGSLAFMNKKWLEAMLLYTKSYIALPQDKKKDIAIVLANRSAALYHLQKYDETLVDIERSLDNGYPKEMQYKLFERQARCFLAKHNYPSTIAAFKKCITALDEAKLPKEKKNKIILDAMTMVKMLEKDPRTAKQTEKQKNAGIYANLPTMAIPEEKEHLSESVEFADSNGDCGRFARAVTSIQMGEEILVEKPFVAVLLERYSKTHCENCFMRTVIPVACTRCADVVYCSEKCLNISAKSYHKYECGILPTIWRSGASVNCHMALRLIASRSLEYYLIQADQVDEQLALEEILKLPRDDYRRVSHLVRHEENRSASNFFHHVLMARFLLKCLQSGGYFDDKITKPNDLLKICGLLLRNIEFIQFNTHEVAELHVSKDHTKKNTIFVGGALYPTLALFNHSCDPGIVRGTTIHVNTIKPIESGLEISENYGPIYTQEPRDKRQAKLKDLYWFDCTCDPCLENWPTFDKLPTDVIRFRCDAPNKCTAVIEVPADCNDFMITCVTCKEATNIFKGLKVMQDTEVMTRTALRYYESGDYTKALNKYIDLVRIMYEVLAPPFPDFCQCQQHAKDCFLHFGNVYSLD